MKNVKILGFPLWLYAVLTLIMVILGAMDWLPGNMLGSLAFALIVGTLLGYIGNQIPVWKTWFGGGMLFTCLVAGAMNTFHLIGPNAQKAINIFNGKTGFLDFYICMLITGSVLALERKVLIKSFVGYIPTILGGVVCALGLAGAVGQLTGIGWVNAVCNYAIPIMGGGTAPGYSP